MSRAASGFRPGERCRRCGQTLRPHRRAVSSAGVARAATITALVGLLSMIAVAGWWFTRPAPRPRASRAPFSDSLAALEPWTAYQHALALGKQHRFDQSLPYFRRALADPPSAWEPYCDYAISLFQAGHQTRAHRGRIEPVARSSFERVSWMHEAWDALEHAEARAALPEAEGYVIGERARALAAWGLPWNAVSEYMRGGERDSALRGKAFELAGLMRDPLGRSRTR